MRIDDGVAAGALVAGSPDRFGYEWERYSEIRPEYEEQFRRWTVHLEPEDWRGLRFIDVGCGMGRNSLWPMRYGAAGGLAIDVDARSLAAARRNLAEFPQLTVRELSAYDIAAVEEDAQQDAALGGFDIAFSIGVIHHLEFPEAAVRAMAKAVKPGGRVLIWVYGRENNGWIVRLLDPLRKALFSRLPIALVHHLALYPALLVSPLGICARSYSTRCCRKSRITGGVRRRSRCCVRLGCRRFGRPGSTRCPGR